MEWLKRAQDSTGDGGVSSGYFKHYGWDASYPETTGYIIPTFFDYAHLANDIDCRRRAVAMSDFLLSIQMDNGAFRLGNHGAFPIGIPHIFDSGQIMQGLTRCYRETKQEKYLESAVKTGNWLVESQDKDGAWRKYSYRAVTHTTYTRVGLALLELFEVVEDRKYKEAAIKNIEWAISKCNKKGWFHDCGGEIELMSNPWTHFIAYAAEGILECGVKLNNNNFIRVSTRTMNSILTKFKIENRIRGTYYNNWESNDNYSCLTGDAQIALIWVRIFELSKDRTYYDCAVKLNDYLKTTQYLHHWNKGVEGGIKGSQPIYGRYNPHRYLNWAAKFFADLQIKLISLNSD